MAADRAGAENADTQHFLQAKTALILTSLLVYDSPAMDISAEEIKQFWRGWCQRRKIAADLVAKGEAEIDKDPEHWADETMDQLLELIKR